MSAQINHMAMNSPIFPMLLRFYEAVFDLRPTKVSRPMSGGSIGDGYCGLNINPLRDGYVGGLDHFGMTVEDTDIVMERARKKFPQANIVKRPSTRPFAAFSAHDPDGNVFDLAERNKSQLDGIYSEQAKEKWSTRSQLNKFAIRTMNPDKCADFYMEVFDLKPINRSTSVPGHHLTDGRVTLSLLPWSIPIFEGMSIKRPGPDHLGIKVESIDGLKERIAEVTGGCSYLAPMPMGGGKEADARKKLLAESSFGKFQLTDPGGVWIDVTDE